MYKRFGKRFVDLIVSIVLLPFFIVIGVVVGIVIKLEDGGPVFYCGERLGKGAKVIKMVKFRSMKMEAPDIRNADGTTYNAQDDFRLTKIGKFMRETSMDELPQILNILKGEMSFIGPRPSLPDMLALYRPEEMPKLDVLPGITGYTQAYHRNALSGQGKRVKDAWYAQHVSFWLDCRILIKTFRTVVKGDGLYTNQREVGK